jgi:hypothetical protein
MQLTQKFSYPILRHFGSKSCQICVKNGKSVVESLELKALMYKFVKHHNNLGQFFLEVEQGSRFLNHFWQISKKA